VFINQTQIVTVGVAVVCFLLVAWFFRSRLGVAMRATAFDQEAAQAQGINVGRIFAMAWAIGAALAAVAGIFSSMAPRAAGVSNTTAFVVFRAFPAIIIGGLDSVMGAVVGGFLVGIAEMVIGTYATGYSNVLGVGFGGVVPYLLMLVFLLFRPYGLFGTQEIRRV
jgi:branched-chain amino acid transport system permease protein